MNNPDKLWKDICYRYAEQSKCKSRKVGCVLVFEDRCIGQGWNGAPIGSKTDDCTRKKCKTGQGDVGSDSNQSICCHAEINCISYCARHGVSTRGSTLYTTTFPCIYCAGSIVAAGVKTVVYDLKYTEDCETTKNIFKNSGVEVRRFLDRE
jgi:dCMP deaminase